MTHSYRPRARSTDLVIQAVESETLVYDLRTNEAHCLNETATFVWSRCDGNSSVEDIARSFGPTVTAAASGTLIQLALSQLSERRLLDERAPDMGSTMDRRQMMKKLGAASVVAIPVIASIIAPPRALGSISCSCTSPSSCAAQTGCMGFNCNSVGDCAPDTPRPSSVQVKRSA